MNITATGGAVAEAPQDSAHGHAQGPLYKLAIGAIGIVFGDIGTSPIYAFRETFAGHHTLIPDRLHIYGVLSLFFSRALFTQPQALGILDWDQHLFYYASVLLWLAGLLVWRRVDRSMARSAMEAIGEDETAAASVGIHVTRFKVGITALSAALTAVGGVAYAQYISYVNPDTLAGIGVSLRIVFAVVLGGMYSLLGPTVGTALTIALSEYLRIVLGLKFIGMAETIYGLLLILFIIFLPAGIYGSLASLVSRVRRGTMVAGSAGPA